MSLEQVRQSETEVTKTIEIPNKYNDENDPTKLVAKAIDLHKRLDEIKAEMGAISSGNPSDLKIFSLLKIENGLVREELEMCEARIVELKKNEANQESNNKPADDSHIFPESIRANR